MVRSPQLKVCLSIVVSKKKFYLAIILEQLKTNDRALRKVGRDVERDRREIEREEKKLELEIKKAAKMGNKQVILRTKNKSTLENYQQFSLILGMYSSR